MALTRVQIISNAVSLLGKGIVTTLANPSPLVAAADQAFDFLYPSVISQSRWRFASKIAPLANLNVTPLGGYWNYTYAIPLDYLELLRIFPQTWDYEIFSDGLIYSNFFAASNTYVISSVSNVSNTMTIGTNLPAGVYSVTFTTSGTLPTTTPQIDNTTTYYIFANGTRTFKVFGNYTGAFNNTGEFTITNIGTGQSSILIQNTFVIEYIFLPDVLDLPPYFTHYFATEIAAYLALSIAQSTDYAQILDAKANSLWLKAKAIDAKNRPQIPLQSQPILGNRYVSQFAYG